MSFDTTTRLMLRLLFNIVKFFCGLYAKTIFFKINAISLVEYRLALVIWFKRHRNCFVSWSCFGDYFLRVERNHATAFCLIQEIYTETKTLKLFNENVKAFWKLWPNNRLVLNNGFVGFRSTIYIIRLNR